MKLKDNRQRRLWWRPGPILLATIAVVLLTLVWKRGWFSGEPTYDGRTVTDWLNRLVLYDHRGEEIRLRSPEAILQDPAYCALLQIGSKGVPVFTNILIDRAEWAPEIGAFKRCKMWLEWRWHRVRGAQVSRPAPGEWSQAQQARKTAAGLVLVGLGTNAGGGFSKYMDVYAAAPRHQSVYGTKVAGAPVGVSSYDVVRSVISVMPERREEIIAEVMTALDHTNAVHRTVALECAHAFREDVLQRGKSQLVSLTRDEDPLVQEAALGNLLMIVQIESLSTLMPAAEIAPIARVILDDSRISPRARFIANRLLNLATNRIADYRPDQ